MTCGTIFNIGLGCRRFSAALGYSHWIFKAEEALHLNCGNKLSVNVDKTKIVAFCKGNNINAKRLNSFKFGKETIEVVNEYVHILRSNYCF